MVTPGEQLGHRWRARSRAGFFVSAAAFAIPLSLSVLAAFMASVFLPHPVSVGWRVAWWIAVLLIAWAAAMVGERVARPLLPLASLLKMSMLFPDRAPSRFAVAWRSGSTRQLDRYIKGVDASTHREPMEAAMEILTLVAALSSHDRRTRGHSERVRAYTDLLATELRLPQGDVDRLRWASLLHDVGKMSVDTKILNKSGEPTEEEWAILRHHPTEGGRLIAPIREWLGEWALAVEQHHENYDGTGYPRGLAGDEISYGARIVAVADAFEVMTAPRSYKTSMSSAAARRELTNCAGTQFDPAIVRAFLNVSVGRQRWIIGPLSWALDVPVVSLFGNLGNVLVASSQVALVTGSVALGAVAASTHDTRPSHPVAISATAAALEHETIVPELSTTSVDVAGTFRGDALISSATSGTGGTVTYEVFNNASCDLGGGGLVARLGVVTVLAGEVPESTAWTAPASTGTYYFVAVYQAADEATTTSKCDGAPFTVTPDAPQISARLSSTSITTGSAVVASASLNGASPHAGGTVTYGVFGNATCTASAGGLVTTLGPVKVINGEVTSSSSWSATAAGTYYVVASYSGDRDNHAASSGCAATPLIVAGGSVTPTPPTPPSPPTPPTPPTPPAPPSGPSSPTITTQASPSSAAIGATVVDSATLAGATGNASGSVTYEVFDNASCSSASGGLLAALGPVSVSGGSVPNSPSWTATEPVETVYFVAAYTGDGNNNVATSACGADPVSVTTSVPTLVAQASATSLVLGATTTENATLSGATVDAGGTLTYDVFNNGTCSSAAGGLVDTLGTVTVTGGVVPVSATWTASEPAGTYYFVATYGGDANNASATSSCAADAVVVAPDAATITTQATAPFVALGSNAFDTATLYDATADAGGTVTYEVFNNGTCSSAAGGLVATLATVTVTNGVVATSPAWTANAPAGTYYFVALYSGDTNNAAASSWCSGDPFTIG